MEQSPIPGRFRGSYTYGGERDLGGSRQAYGYAKKNNWTTSRTKWCDFRVGEILINYQWNSVCNYEGHVVSYHEFDPDNHPVETSQKRTEGCSVQHAWHYHDSMEGWWDTAHSFKTKWRSDTTWQEFKDVSRIRENWA